MKINLTTIIFLISHLVTFYYLNMFVDKIKKMLKKIENIEKEIEAKEKNLNKNIQDDLEKEKKIEKILEKEEKILEKEEKNVKYYSEEIENKEEEDEDEDKYNDYDNSEKKEIIEGFNNINYNDFIENKMKVASSTVYDTDFSNIYNTYVKDNILDIQKVKESNDSIYNDTSFYLKSKCRGWKKKNKV